MLAQRLFLVLFLSLLTSAPGSATTDFNALYKTSDMHCLVSTAESKEWEVTNLPIFNEVLLSWNARRPQQGTYTFYLSVKTHEWSPWIKYAEWGSDLQRSSEEKLPHFFINSYQDTVNIAEGQILQGLKIKVVANAGADLNDVYELFLSLSNLEQLPTITDYFEGESLNIKHIPQKSQIALNSPLSRRVCSPTSTAMVVNYLREQKGLDLVDTLDFAEQVRDQTFDIYGNWSLNVAQAYHSLQGLANVYLKRLNGFQELHQILSEGIPIVVSVKGNISRAPLPYNEGHLMVVNGWDEENQEVICIDPAFDKDEKTLVSYPLKDFLKVWSERKYIAYVFTIPSLDEIDTLENGEITYN
ncbi:MAG: hypothetical protein K0S74_1503 [Chlamydiales bacterium]|nr:hypothetical protein [Chlamydiales bacterium]